MHSTAEWLSWASDILGFLGALGLAWPFLRRQRDRDDLLSALLLDAPDPADMKIFRESIKETAHRVLATADRDYRVGILSAFLVAVAFMAKLMFGYPGLAH